MEIIIYIYIYMYNLITNGEKVGFEHSTLGVSSDIHGNVHKIYTYIIRYIISYDLAKVPFGN